MNRLNTARVAFKHEGLGVVNAHEVQGFVSNVGGFLTEVCDKVLKIDFAQITNAPHSFKCDNKQDGGGGVHHTNLSDILRKLRTVYLTY